MGLRSDNDDFAVYQGGGDSAQDLSSRFLQKLGRDTRRYFPAAIIPAAASLAGVAIYTRIFASADYGRYSLVVAAVAVCNVLFSGWIQQSTLRYLPRHRAGGDLPVFFSRVLGVILGVCISVAALSAAGYFLGASSLGGYGGFYLPAVVWLLAEMVFFNVNTLYQAGLRSKTYAFYRITSSIVRLAFALGFVFFIRKDVVGLIAGAALGQLVLIFPMAYGLRSLQRGIKLKVSFEYKFLRVFAAYGIPVIGWMVGGQVLGLSDRFIIGVFRGSAEVGIYSANYNLVNMGFGLVATPLLMAAHPLIITAWEKNARGQVSGVIAAFTRFYLMAAIPVVVLVSVFSREIVQLLLGPGFHEGFRILPFVLAGSWAWGLAQYGHKGMEIMEKTRVMVALVAVSAVVNVVLNIIFVPRYGYYAAAVTTFVSYFLYPVLVYFSARSYFPWRIPWRTMFKTVLAAVITGGLILAAKSALPAGFSALGKIAAGGVIGAGLYAALLAFLREIGKDELNLLLRKD